MKMKSSPARAIGTLNQEGKQRISTQSASEMETPLMGTAKTGMAGMVMGAGMLKGVVMAISETTTPTMAVLTATTATVA